MRTLISPMPRSTLLKCTRKKSSREVCSVNSRIANGRVSECRRQCNQGVWQKSGSQRCQPPRLAFAPLYPGQRIGPSLAVRGPRIINLEMRAIPRSIVYQTCCFINSPSTFGIDVHSCARCDRSQILPCEAAESFAHNRLQSTSHLNARNAVLRLVDLHKAHAAPQLDRPTVAIAAQKVDESQGITPGLCSTLQRLASGTPASDCTALRACCVRER